MLGELGGAINIQAQLNKKSAISKILTELIEEMISKSTISN